MSNVLKENIALRMQPTWTVYNQSPNNAIISEKNLQADSSQYEDYSFTGNLEEILEQEATELGKGNSKKGGKVPNSTDTYFHGTFVTTTRTRLEGDIWQLQVRIQPLLWANPEEEKLTPEQIKEQKEKMGEKENPNTENISVTAVQQSILFHPAYREFNAVQLGAIKRYMTGTSPGTLVPDMPSEGDPGPNEPSIPFKHWLINLGGNTAKAAEFALKHPTYYVANVSITLGYFSETDVAETRKVGEIVTSVPTSPPITAIPGYQIRFMGCNQTKVKGGYKVTESYVIGDFQQQSPSWYQAPN